MSPVASLLSLVTAAVTVASPAAGFNVLTPGMRQSSAKHHGEQRPASSTRPSTGNIGYGNCDAPLPSRAGVISNLQMSGAQSSSEQTESARTGSPARSQVSVSRAFNRALGTILSTGDMFGSVGGGGVGLERSSFRQKRPRRNNNDAATKRSTPSDSELGQRLGERDEEDGDDDSDDDDHGVEGDYPAGKSVEDLSRSSTGTRDERPMWRRISQRRMLSTSRKSNTNRLLRASSDASAAIVVDGPFSALESYMTLPASEYSLLDSSIIRRVSDTAFLFQTPLKDLVGLDFTPTMEVEVELDPKANAVVFRSTRSTLYGNVAPAGQLEGGGTDPWPAATGDRKVEYFRVGFDAHLRWAKGDASTDPRRRGSRNGFAGDVARRPRPPSRAPSSAAMEMGVDVRSDSDTSTAASMPEAEVGDIDGVVQAAAKEVELRAERGTLFCETEVRVQVLLPPPYNTVLPWRLVRALLGKVLSTVVSYVLPRFLELLADDFYSWQSSSRRAAATAGENGRTLLGAKTSQSSPTNRSTVGSNTLTGGDKSGGAPFAGRWRVGVVGGGTRAAGGRDTSSRDTTETKNNAIAARLRGVDLGVQRLRSIRVPGSWGSPAAAGGIGGGAEEKGTASPSATVQSLFSSSGVETAGSERRAGGSASNTTSSGSRVMRGRRNRAALESLYEWASSGGVRRRDSAASDDTDSGIVGNDADDTVRYEDDMEEFLEAVDDDIEKNEEGERDSRPAWRRGAAGRGGRRWRGGRTGTGRISWWG